MNGEEIPVWKPFPDWSLYRLEVDHYALLNVADALLLAREVVLQAAAEDLTAELDEGRDPRVPDPAEAAYQIEAALMMLAGYLAAVAPHAATEALSQ